MRKRVPPRGHQPVPVQGRRAASARGSDVADRAALGRDGRWADHGPAVDDGAGAAVPRPRQGRRVRCAAPPSASSSACISIAAYILAYAVASRPRPRGRWRWPSQRRRSRQRRWSSQLWSWTCGRRRSRAVASCWQRFCCCRKPRSAPQPVRLPWWDIPARMATTFAWSPSFWPAPISSARSCRASSRRFPSSWSWSAASRITRAAATPCCVSCAASHCR